MSTKCAKGVNCITLHRQATKDKKEAELTKAMLLLPQICELESL